ncbi:hypothetical protein Ahu01nite_070700 [Winogradskya humida]|uniref:Uncharacterized protein n=1 Tax=Winogradskya humida TaxID=113566 RepID=A0ABQ3ZZE9_9ACTN|nr:hypothetical protein Ahu01nite_070700 [Actinoplanes humidus]
MPGEAADAYRWAGMNWAGRQAGRQAGKKASKKASGVGWGEQGWGGWEVGLSALGVNALLSR